MQNSFSTVRLKTSTLEQLRNFKSAYESAMGERYSMDRFFEILIENSKKADPDIWEIFQLKSRLEEEIQRKIQESRTKRSLNNASDFE